MHRAVALRQADIARLDNSRFCKTKGSRPLCNDGAVVAGRLRAGANVVVLSAPEESAGSAGSQSRLGRDSSRGVDLLYAPAE